MDKEHNQGPTVAIIGVGGFGAFHARALSLLQAQGLCRLVAACDPYIDSQTKTLEKELNNIRLYRSYEEVLRGDVFDYIVVASPPHLHYQHTVEALNRGSFVYLEKPPVPTFAQLAELLKHPAAGRVAVGFQMQEARVLRTLGDQLRSGDLGEILEVSASGLWPRTTSYYRRTVWAGKMEVGGRPVLDGPLTNALSHIVQMTFFLAARKGVSSAVPATVSGFFSRARPIESYDFAWLKGLTAEGVLFNILGGHCADKAIPWKVTIKTTRGTFSVEESDIPSVEELIIESHRSAFAARRWHKRITTSLADCAPYCLATSIGLDSSLGIHSIPTKEIAITGVASETTYHVERVYQLIKRCQEANGFVPTDVSWIKWGGEIHCSELLDKFTLSCG